MALRIQSPALGPLTIRSATSSDQPAVRALVFSVLHEHAISMIADDPQDADLDDLEGWYRPPAGTFEVIASAEGRILGCGGIHRIDDERCELRKLYFLPELRGQGLGSAFLHRLVMFACSRGYRVMELETARSLETARGMYVRRGFRERPVTACPGRCDSAFELHLADYRPPDKLRPLETSAAQAQQQ